MYNTLIEFKEFLDQNSNIKFKDVIKNRLDLQLKAYLQQLEESSQYTKANIKNDGVINRLLK